MTPTQIIEDEQFLCGLTYNDIKTYLLYSGGERVEYYVFKGETILFHGKDFRPSPLYGQDSLESIVSLLSFITLKKGDTDSDYFKDYTSEQLEWSESNECEELSLLLYDYGNCNGDTESNQYRLEAKEKFEGGYIN